MTLADARSKVIGKFIDIESMVDEILIREIKPCESRATFVSEIMFNTAIISTAGKFKLIRHLMALNKWPSVPDTHFHKLLEIRNQFAHAKEQLGYFVNVTTRKGAQDMVEVSENIYLESLNGQGKLMPTNFSVGYSEFEKHFEVLHNLLSEIEKAQISKSESDSG